MLQFERIDSSDERVSKYIFYFDGAIAEAVLYRYPDFKTRTVLCISVMSGCPVGCTFCGTGKHFVRNLTSQEIVNQVTTVFDDWDITDINRTCEKLQIMFMSMGEPMLNWDNVEMAIEYLNKKYSNADLLISTMGIRDMDVFKRIILLSVHINKVGLQFSVHRLLDNERNKLIPYNRKMDLVWLRDAALQWYIATGRNPYINICVSNDSPLASLVCLDNELKRNDFAEEGQMEYQRLLDLFPSFCTNLTLSVICQADETMAQAQERNIDILSKLASMTTEEGYNTRIFDPAGQDDIGGGCGQLWHFQKWLKSRARA